MRQVVEEWFFGGDGLVDEFQAPVGEEIGAVPVVAERGVVLLVLLAVEDNTVFAALDLLGKVELADGSVQAAHEAASTGGVPCMEPRCHLPAMKVK